MFCVPRRFRSRTVSLLLKRCVSSLCKELKPNCYVWSRRADSDKSHFYHYKELMVHLRMNKLDQTSDKS